MRLKKIFILIFILLAIFSCGKPKENITESGQKSTGYKNTSKFTENPTLEGGGFGQPNPKEISR